MALQHAYAITNKISTLAAASFTWSTGATTNRTYVNDGKIDRAFAVGAVASSANVIIDFGAATSINAVAILNHNLARATGATVKVEAADNAGITVNAVTPKAVTTLYTTAPRDKDHVLQFTAVSKRYWRITFAWTGTFSMTVGELFLASTTALSRAMVYGNATRLEYVNTQFTAYTGASRGHFIAGPIRARDIRWEDLSASERTELDAMFMGTRGGALSILWIEQYETTATAADSDHQECIYGRVQESVFTESEFDFGRFNPSGLTIRSLGREIGA